MRDQALLLTLGWCVSVSVGMCVGATDAFAQPSESTSTPARAATAAPSPTHTSVVAGRVTDPQGAVVSGARVRLTREDGTLARQAGTSATGEYRLDALPPGIFIVEVGKDGFRRRTDVVTLAAGLTATLDVQLGVGGVDDHVVVTAAGTPQVTQETSKPITLIDAQEIRDRNELSLSEIIRFAPGVQIRNNGGPGQNTSVRLRGLRPDASAILIDGFRYRDASTAQGDASSFLSTLNFVGAERVEVLRGSGSSLYGTNAVGGVINIVTRTGGGPLRGEAQAEGGSLGHVRTRGSLGGGAFGDRLHYAVGALQFNLRDGLDGHDATRSTGVQGRATYRVSPAANLTVRVFGSDDEVDLNVSPTASGIPAANIPQAIEVEAIPVPPDQIARANQGQPFEIGGATYIPGRDDPDSLRASNSHTTALIFRHSAWTPVSWQASYQRVRTSRILENGPLGAGFQPAALNFSRYIGTIDTGDLRGFMTPASWLTLTAGYEFEREGYFDHQDNNLPDPRRTRTETRIAQRAHAGFAGAQIALLDRRLQLSLSGRAQRFDLSNPELSAVGTANAYATIAVSSPPRALTGDVSLSYFLPSSSTKLRVHGGNAYRAAALYERFGGGFTTDPVTGRVLFTAYGDPRLEPDRYEAIDGGVDQYLFGSRLLVSATAFYNDVMSLTAFDSAGGVRPDTDPYGRAAGYVNGKGGFSRGVELGAEARPSASLRLSASYTYTRSETEQDITVPGFYLVPGVFAHTATLVVTQRWSDRLDTTFDLFHASSTYGSFSAAGRPRAYRYPKFTKAAAIAAWRLLPAHRLRVPLRAYAKVDNLFDATYYEGGWRNLGRTAQAGVSVEF